jgi:hypothetical protein
MAGCRPSRQCGETFQRVRGVELSASTAHLDKGRTIPLQIPAPQDWNLDCRHMPYHLDPEITTPSPDTVIWLYMDVLRFLTMLKQSSLYFALLKEVDDSWEGEPSKRLKGELLRFGR